MAHPLPLLERAKHWLEPVIGLFYPNVCQLCEKQPAAKKQGYVCDVCRAEVKRIQAPFCACCGLPFNGAITQSFECFNCKDLDLSFKWARASAASEGVVLEAIHRFKYNGGLWFEPFLVDLWLEGARETLAQEHFDFLVPVPLHPQKQREREFNQAERLVRALARKTKITARSDLLDRVRATTTQTKLDRQERAANVKRAFAMRNSKQLNGQRILLVDDVLTTGATTSACAAALLRGGAREVCVWTVARRL
jgi:competence protein ComFC